jgi:ATP-dependent Lhr-like helicase
VPTKTTIVAERFFDEGGGQQLILHAPFGGRINKAWGLALRKRFCRGFNFELQAAATDNGLNISLAEQHSFPLADVFHFLTEQTTRTLLEQAAIPSPLFKNRWRWAAGRSLQLLRMQKGKRVAPQIQRTRSDDLLANVFPQAAACFETLVGDIQIPDHPLVREVMKDTLTEAMDIEGLLEVLRGIDSGAIRCVAVDTPVPSLFAHELIHAMPYAYLDEAGVEERRARAVSTRRTFPDAVTDGAGKLDQAAIDTVREQLWPDLRDEHELHDLLLSLVALPLEFLAAHAQTASTQHWPLFFDRLVQNGRARTVELNGSSAWVATERLPEAALLWPEAALPNAGANTVITREAATLALTQGWLQLLGPTRAADLAACTHLQPESLHQALLAMEMQGLAMRGVFERPAPPENRPFAIEWCERRILQRIHRLTLATLRKQVEPVSPAVFMRWLLDWQHLAPQTQLSGEEGVLAAIEQLEAFEAPAIEWERRLLPARIANYDSRWLDNLCLAGVVGWGRLSPHPAWLSSVEPAATRRVIPTSAAPITFYLRESSAWLHHALGTKSVEESVLAESLSPEAQQIRALLGRRGAAFAADLQQLSGLTKVQTSTALWELATAGLASADGFDPLRAMIDPRRKPIAASQTPSVSLRKRTSTRTSAGRWSLLAEPVAEMVLAGGAQDAAEARRSQAIQLAKQKDAALDACARILLCRYGVLFRDLLARESNAPRWRDLLPVLRRLEARGEIRGGRFVGGPFGEQYALPEAVESLRIARRLAETRETEEPIRVAAADPLNLAGILVPGERVAAVPGRDLRFRNGVVVEDELSTPLAPSPLRPARARNIADILRAEAITPRSALPVPSEARPGLFP